MMPQETASRLLFFAPNGRVGRAAPNQTQTAGSGDRRRTNQVRTESSRDQCAVKANFAACQGGAGCDSDKSSLCGGTKSDALSLESSERTLRRLAASAITRKLGRSDGAAHFGLVPLGPFWLTGTFASILSGWRVGIEAVRPDFACMRLMVDRNPPAGVCPAKPGLKLVTRCWASSSFLRSEN